MSQAVRTKQTRTDFHAELEGRFIGLSPESLPFGQAVFAALLILDLLLRYAGAPVTGAAPAFSVLILLVATAAAFLFPWSRLPDEATAAVAMLDFLVVGVSKLDPGNVGSAVLAVLPAIYLARTCGRRGVLLAALGSAALVVGPTIVMGDDGRAAMSRVFLGAVVAVVAAAAVSSAMAAASRSRSTMSAVVDSLPIGLILIDAEKHYSLMNQRQDEVMRLAFPGTEDNSERTSGGTGLVFGADGVTLLPPEQWPSARAIRGDDLDGERIWVGDDPLTRKALAISTRTVRGPRGEPLGASVACADVTDLVCALEVKDQFISSVSHELRTPLTSISGYTYLLLDRSDLDLQARRHLEVIARNTKRLTRLVADLLTVAQHDQGTGSLGRSDCDITALVGDAVQSATPAADAKHIAISLTAPPHCQAPVDALRIAQVVDNLISNAIKYTPAGGRVMVEVGDRADALEISVHDTGVGLSPDDRDRVFDRFFRTRDAQDSVAPGVGLGLSIVQEIVVAHDGTVSVDSEAGVGSTFRIEIPLAVADPAPTRTARPTPDLRPVHEPNDAPTGRPTDETGGEDTDHSTGPLAPAGVAC